MKKIHHPLPPRTAAEHTAYRVVQRLRDAGYLAYTVGGAVRDRLLERLPQDCDVTTDATPQQVMALFPRTVAVGAAFGVVIVMDGDQQVEVATFRVDLDYRDGRRPDAVRFATPEEDATRRDFTVNALFYDPAEAVIVDYIGGFDDLARGVLRAIGDPAARFAEDYLRLLRAVRFAAHLDFTLDAATRAAVAATAPRITAISHERVYAELTKMLTGRFPHRAFALLHDTGLLRHILPELAAMDGVAQPPEFHPEGDVWVHTLLLLRHMVHPSPELAWSVLLHDVGKPPTFAINKHGRESFPCHASVGADMTRDILRRLRAANDFTETVATAVYYHMTFGDARHMKTATKRRMVGRPSFPMELELHRIDCLACHGKLDSYVLFLDFLHDLANTPAMPEPFLNGRDLIARGLRPGPAFGPILEQAMDRQLEGELADRDAALAWLDRFLAEDANGR